MGTETKRTAKPTAAARIRERVAEIAQTIRDLDPLACDSSLCMDVGQQVIDTHRAISCAAGKRIPQ